MTSPQSPNLEVVSENGAREPGDGSERRRLARLSLSGEQFRHGRSGKVFAVTDLSSHGMALRIIDEADFVLFPVAAAFEGTINLKGEKHPVKAKVRHIRADSIGCEFEALAPHAQAALAEFLSPEVLGRELRPFPTSPDGAGSHVWYHAPSGADLVLRRHGSGAEFHRLTLYFLGGYVQWDEGEGVSSGQTEKAASPAETRGLLRFETWILRPDAAARAEQLKVAKTLILSSNLAEDLKRWCLGKLGEKPHGS